MIADMFVPAGGDEWRLEGPQWSIAAAPAAGDRIDTKAASYRVLGVVWNVAPAFMAGASSSSSDDVRDVVSDIAIYAVPAEEPDHAAMARLARAPWWGAERG